jgi:hypothetical protein
VERGVTVKHAATDIKPVARLAERYPVDPD